MARKIRNAEGDSEEEIDGNIDLFLRNVPDSDATKYFFSGKFEGMTLEEIVDNAVKQDYVYLHPAVDGKELYKGLEEFLTFYNYEKTHQGIGRIRPADLYLNAA